MPINLRKINTTCELNSQGHLTGGQDYFKIKLVNRGGDKINIDSGTIIPSIVYIKRLNKSKQTGSVLKYKIKIN
ncbi:hypothetical protein [Bacillus cereus]|uniref:hypothetical protein n=1 Tax=Bacillus cereus TaxID=1396 RepID=UPI003980D55E